MYDEVAWILVSSRTQVQPQIIFDQNYLPDYLSVSYSYEQTVSIKQWIVNNKQWTSNSKYRKLGGGRKIATPDVRHSLWDRGKTGIKLGKKHVINYY